MQAGSHDPLESPETGLTDQTSHAEGGRQARAFGPNPRPPTRLDTPSPCGGLGGSNARFIRISSSWGLRRGGDCGRRAGFPRIRSRRPARRRHRDARADADRGSAGLGHRDRSRGDRSQPGQRCCRSAAISCGTRHRAQPAIPAKRPRSLFAAPRATTHWCWWTACASIPARSACRRCRTFRPTASNASRSSRGHARPSGARTRSAASSM